MPTKAEKRRRRRERRHDKRERRDPMAREIMRAWEGRHLLKTHRTADGRGVYLDLTNRMLADAPMVRELINSRLKLGLALALEAEAEAIDGAPPPVREMNVLDLLAERGIKLGDAFTEEGT